MQVTPQKLVARQYVASAVAALQVVQSKHVCAEDLRDKRRRKQASGAQA